MRNDNGGSNSLAHNLLGWLSWGVVMIAMAQGGHAQNGQAFEWAMGSRSSANEQAEFVAEIPGTTDLAVCANATDAFGRGHVLWVRTDADGAAKWHRRWSPVADLAVARGASMAPDSTFLITGTTNLDYGPEAPFIACFDAAGNLLWANTFGEGRGLDVFFYNNEIYALSLFASAYRLMKLDKAGTLLQQTQLGYDQSFVGGRLCVNATGVTVLGQVSNANALPDLATINLDFDLLVQSACQWQADLHESVVAIVPLANPNEVVLVGQARNPYDTMWPNQPDLFAVGIRNNTEVLWSLLVRSLWRGPGGSIWVQYPDLVREAIRTPDDQVLLAGTQDHYEGFRDAFLVQIDPVAALVTKHARVGGFVSEQGRTIAVRNGGFALAGVQGGSMRDIYLVGVPASLALNPCFERPVEYTVEAEAPIIARANLVLQPLSSSVMPTPLPLTESEQDFESRTYSVQLKTQVMNETCAGSNDGIITLSGKGNGPFAYFLGPSGATDFYPKTYDSAFAQLAPGSYRVAAADANGCETDALVEILPAQPIRFQVDSLPPKLCENETTTIHLSGSGNGTTQLLWEGSTYSPVLVDSTRWTVPNVAVGNYSATLLDAHGCNSTLLLAIEAGPSVDAGPPDTFTLPLGPGLEPHRQLSNGNPEWGTWSGPFLVNENGLLNLAAADTGTFDYTLSAGRCSDIRKVVLTDSVIRPMFPNAFSPNADGHDDVFQINLPRHSGFKMQVWDRWGKLLFESNEISKPWDGANAPDGVYVFVLKATFAHGRSQEWTGTIGLIR